MVNISYNYFFSDLTVDFAYCTQNSVFMLLVIVTIVEEYPVTVGKSTDSNPMYIVMF